MYLYLLGKTLSRLGDKISMEFSISSEYLISRGEGFIFPTTTSLIVESNCLKLFFFLATVPTTGTPKRRLSFSKSTKIPFFLASSNKLTQTITFGVSSIV